MIDPTTLVGLVGLGLLGGAVGVVTGSTGAGGGALAVPLLTVVAGLPLGEAVPVSLLAVGLSALVGALSSLRAGELRWRAAILIGGAGMLSAPLGVTLAQHLPAAPLLLVLAALLLFTAWRQWHPPRPAGATPRAPVCVRESGGPRIAWSKRCAATLFGVGLGTGAFSGLFGLGGGFVMVPALQRLSDLDLRHIQATSLAIIAAVSASAIVAATAHGAWPGAPAWPFAAGCVAGMLAGRRLARRTRAELLKRGFAVVAALVALTVLVKVAAAAV